MGNGRRDFLKTAGFGGALAAAPALLAANRARAEKADHKEGRARDEIGKTPDDFAPLGPWLVTADQISNPNSLDIWCDVNGERRQSSNTADMVFNCAQLVSYCSQHMTLEPGDIIYTGTPEGVIAGMPEGKRVWLKPGDHISCGIEKLGELKFAFV